MRRRIARPLALAAGALALAAVGAAATHDDAQARGGKPRALHAHVLKAAAEYLGLARAELRRELPGHSLAQLATARGKSVDGLEAAILAPAKARLDRAQSAGRLTAAQAAERLARLEPRIEKLVQHVFGERIAALHARVSPKHIALRAAAEYLGLSRVELRSRLKGTSLAALAVARGKSVDGLEAAILEPFRARLDRARASGRISPQQAAQRLARIERRIAELVAKTF